MKNTPAYTFKSKDTTVQAAAGMAGKNGIAVTDNRNSTPVQQQKAKGLSGKPVTQAPVQKKQNKTGLPENLQSGIEHLSGMSMDGVNVHYNSEKPAQLNAYAYAQGSDIHIAPGQEKHLPHEAWHVVQQKQGRVKPTMQLKGNVAVNDDRGLEQEADLMGQKALQRFSMKRPTIVQRAYSSMGNDPLHSVSASPLVQRSAQPSSALTTSPGGVALPANYAASLRHDYAGMVTQAMSRHSSGPAVAQLSGWAYLPGIFVIGEGLLSLTTAGFVNATSPASLFQYIPAYIVGGMKLLRGAIMIGNVYYQVDPGKNPWVKGAIDALRLLEAASSTASAFGGPSVSQEENKKFAMHIISALFALIKVARSIGHFFETVIKKNYPSFGYIYSMILQGIETLEGLLVAVNGIIGITDGNTVTGSLGIGTGTSKVTRGVVAGKLAYNKKPGTQPQVTESSSLISSVNKDTQTENLLI